MPAYFDTGFSVREPMWHGLGNVLDEAPETWDDARLAGGLLWEPAEEPVYRRRLIPASGLPDGAVDLGDGWCMTQVADHKLVARDDTAGELAVVRSEMPLISHATMGDVLESVAKEAGSTFRFETAGSVQGGRKVWALAWLDEPFTVPGDDGPTYPFFAVQNAHDGQGAFRVIPTSVRIVCWNTFQAASREAEQHGWSVTIRHAGNVDERIEEAKLSVSRVRATAAAYQSDMGYLAGLRYDDAILSTFLDEFLPAPEGGSARLVEARARKQAVCRKMMTDSPTLAPLPDTAYKLVAMAGEYLDHMRAVKDSDTYLRRTMFGEGNGRVVKSNVIELARELCEVGV